LKSILTHTTIKPHSGINLNKYKNSTKIVKFSVDKLKKEIMQDSFDSSKIETSLESLQPSEIKEKKSEEGEKKRKKSKIMLVDFMMLNNKDKKSKFNPNELDSFED